MKERSFQAESYRYGFNGKENDTDWEVQDYGFRIYKPELGKFLSVDPLSASYPWNSVYAFAENSPIENLDLDGLEKLNFRAIYDSRTFTLILVKPTAEEIEKFTKATNLHCAMHGDPIFLNDEYMNMSAKTNFLFSDCIFSACETGMFMRNTKKPIDDELMEQQRKAFANPDINVLILSTDELCNKFQKDYFPEVEGEVRPPSLPSATNEAETLNYNYQFIFSNTDFAFVPLSEIDSWGLSEKSLHQILLDQYDRSFGENPKKEEYKNATDKKSVINYVRSALVDRDKNMKLDEYLKKGIRIGYLGGSVKRIDEASRKEAKSDLLFISGDKGIIVNK